MKNLRLEGFSIGSLKGLTQRIAAELNTLYVSFHDEDWHTLAFTGFAGLSGFGSAHRDGDPPPFFLLLEETCTRSLKKFIIHDLNALDTSSGLGAEWAAKCEARGIEVCDERV